MLPRRLSHFLFLLSLLPLAGTLHAQDAKQHRGRKYKAPPETSHIEVIVTKKTTGKPIVSAAVVFRATKDGKDDGNLEVKTDPDGKAVIDVIATGSKVQVQVIADGFSTYADVYQIDEPSRQIAVALVKPEEQISAYVDNEGKQSTLKPGVQEPRQPAKPATPPAPGLQPRTSPPPASPDSKSKPAPAPQQ